MQTSDYGDTLNQTVKTLVMLVSCALGLIWLNQTPLSAWWQQTYHSDSPWTLLTSQSWRTGAALMDASTSAKEAFMQSMSAATHVEAIAISEPQTKDVQVNHVGLVTTPAPVAPAEKPVKAAAIPKPKPKPLPEPAPVSSPPSTPTQPAPGRTPLPTPELVSVPSSAPVAVSTLAPSPVRIAVHSLETIPLKHDQRVLFIGDSMMEGIAPHAMKMLRDNWKIAGINISQRSTGLSYPGAFNWPKKLQETLKASADIGVVVVFLGPNDPWDMPSGKGGPFLRFKTPEWEESYRQRIRTVLALANDRQIPVIWVAPPSMRRDKLNKGVAYLSALYESETLQSHNVFLSANTILGYHNGEYNDFIAMNGRQVRLRSDDGIHFTRTAQKLIAESIIAKLQVTPASS